MEVMELSLPATNRLATEYIKGTFPIHEAFHHFTFEERLAYVHERTYAREALVDHLLTYHEQFGASYEKMANIKKLRHPKSVVVIGGQQAGLLTGPLYTIYKIISIITLAKQHFSLLKCMVCRKGEIYKDHLTLNVIFFTFTFLSLFFLHLCLCS